MLCIRPWHAKGCFLMHNGCMLFVILTKAVKFKVAFTVETWKKEDPHAVWQLLLLSSSVESIYKDQEQVERITADYSLLNPVSANSEGRQHSSKCCLWTSRKPDYCRNRWAQLNCMICSSTKSFRWRQHAESNIEKWVAHLNDVKKKKTSSTLPFFVCSPMSESL